MQHLSREDLFSLEDYATARSEFRARVLAHKKNRQVALGPHATLYFEDRLTIQYQIQEMLRVERIFERDAIDEELGAYNPLIPDGSNLKATFMIEYPDAEQRREALASLKGIEDKVWIEAGGERRYAIADEDMERENAEKTSAVHFLRFELTKEMCRVIKSAGDFSIGVDHPNYRHMVSALEPGVARALSADLD